MRPARRALCGAWILLALLLVASVARADRESAEFFADRADKALRSKDWDAAEKGYRRALEEDATFLLAHYGLGQALLGAGRHAEAVESLRRFCRETAALEDAPAAWKREMGKAERLLAKVDALGTRFRELVEKQVEALLAFAAHWDGKDPATARKALEQALALRPKDERIIAELKKLEAAAEAPATPLFNGRDLSGWAAMTPPVWTVKDGLLRGFIDRERGGAWMGRTELRQEGEYDVRMEVRMVEAAGRVPYFGLWVGQSDDYDRTVIAWFKDEVSMLEYSGTKEYEEPYSRPPDQLVPPFDPLAWNVLELRVRKDRIHAVVNGKEVHDIRKRESRDKAFVGLILQNADIEIRRIELRRP